MIYLHLFKTRRSSSDCSVKAEHVLKDFKKIAF